MASSLKQALAFGLSYCISMKSASGAAIMAFLCIAIECAAAEKFTCAKPYKSCSSAIPCCSGSKCTTARGMSWCLPDEAAQCAKQGESCDTAKCCNGLECNDARGVVGLSACIPVTPKCAVKFENCDKVKCCDGLKCNDARGIVGISSCLPDKEDSNNTSITMV